MKASLLFSDPISSPLREYSLDDVFRELQTIAPGATWHERFWVRPSGFERVEGQPAR